MDYSRLARVFQSARNIAVNWIDSIVELPRWVYELAFVLYIVVVSVAIVSERRRPTATLAWIFGLLLLPVLGLIVYFTFSRRRVRRRQKQRRRRAVNAVEETRQMATLASIPETLTDPQRGLVRLALKSSAAPLRRATDVRLLASPVESFAAIQAIIGSAREYIHLEFYMWRPDQIGVALTQLLADKARSGVKVRLLYDEVGSLGLQHTHFADLLAAGGQVAAFGPLKLRWPLAVNFRNHRKCVIVDSRIGLIGGLNIGEEYMGDTTKPRWRDILVEITGDAILGLEATFLEDWLASTGEIVDLEGRVPPGASGADGRVPSGKVGRPPGKLWPRRGIDRRDNPFLGLRHIPVRSDGPLLQIIPSGPDMPVASAIATQFHAAISAAQKRCWITTAYFVPDEALLMALRTTALRGVDVRILVPRPRSSDAPLVALASRSYYDELIEAGCAIYEYQLGMIHAKYLIVDSDVAAIGSANMDVRSFHVNYEITAMFYDRSVTDELARIYLADLGNAKRIENHASTAWYMRLAENAARVLSPLL